MIQCNAEHAVPTEVGFRRQQILTEGMRDEAACHIGQACQNQNPCKKEMIRPVPNRGTDDQRNGKINEGRGCETAGFAPVEARVTYENAYAAHQQTNYAEHDDPVRDTNEHDVARHGYRFDCCFNVSFANHDLPSRSFCHHRSKKEPQAIQIRGQTGELPILIQWLLGPKRGNSLVSPRIWTSLRLTISFDFMPGLASLAIHDSCSRLIQYIAAIISEK